MYFTQNRPSTVCNRSDVVEPHSRLQTQSLGGDAHKWLLICRLLYLKVPRFAALCIGNAFERVAVEEEAAAYLLVVGTPKRLAADRDKGFRGEQVL